MTSPDADSAPETEKSLPDKVAGRYNVKRLLGQGGFGAVYEAYDELEDRPVALKLIRRDVTLDARATRSQREMSTGSSSLGNGSRVGAGRLADGSRRNVTRSFGGTPKTSGDDVTEAFKGEFRLLTQLHHPNLASVYDFGRDSVTESVFFTQELVKGESLLDFLKNASQQTVVEIFVQLARALDYIHALGFVHGDIKPSNVLVLPPETATDQPQAKLIDFGLARMLRVPDRKIDEDAQEDDEDAILVLGTPGFSAPEKVQSNVADNRSDIYSLAATIYAATRGQKPFPARNFKEALRAQKDWRPELAGALLQPCGPVVAELVGRMLQADPELRPQSSRSIVLELLRREATSIRDRQQSAHDRREFARVLVEHLPFVDRAHYLDLLLAKASDVLHPEPTEEDPSASSSRSGTRGRLIRTVVVEAPEGMGKQRLMAELRREIQLGDGLFVQGSCWTSEHSVLGPFLPIVIQLSTALGERSKVVRKFAPLVKLARGQAADDSAAQQLMEFLIACSTVRPYVLHISDMSHGQEPVRNAVEQLCRAIDHNNATILVCATTEPHGKIVPVLQMLSADQVVELWNLRPFSQREMFSVLYGMLGETGVLRDLVTLLDKLTGGHPLTFRETMRVLIEEGILVRDADSWMFRGTSAAAEELHKTLAQRSEARLDGLGVSAWEIASILYLLEAPIDESQLADLSDLRKERFRRTLERLEGEGLILRNTASGVSVISLAHESVRKAVSGRYEDSLDETRLDLAARIDELETEEPNFIYLRARLLDDASEALESETDLTRAAEQLFEVGQPQLGAQVLDRLIRRLRRYGKAAGLQRLLNATLSLLNHAAGALEDPRLEASHYEAGILIAELLGDFRAESLFWLGLADRYATTTGVQDRQLSLDRLERAARAAEQARDRVLELRIANRRAEVLLGLGEVDQAGRFSRQAMEIIDLEQSSDTDKCHIIGVRLRCLSLMGQLGEARRLHDMAKPIAARVPVVQRQSYLSGIAYLAVLGGDAERAIPEVDAAVEEIRGANMPRLLLTPLHNVGDLRLRVNDLEGAESTFREAIRLSTLYGINYHVHLNRGFLGYVIARRGNVEEGAEMLAEAKRGMQEDQGEHVAQQQLRLLDAEVAHMMGQSARARRDLEEMLADFHTTNELSLAHWAQEALARIERDLGTSFIEAPELPDEVDPDPDQDTVPTRQLS
jgi:serine/threonine protein kinase/tetratricopeptide (TPR) repeat protein